MSHQGQEAEGAGHADHAGGCDGHVVQHKPVMTGGHSQAKQADADVQALADTIRGETEKRLGGPLKEFVVEQYKTQVVAGTNFSLKVRIDTDKYVHLKVFKPLGGKTPQLTGMDKDKSSGEEIGLISALEN